MKMDTAAKVNAMSAIRGCLRIELLLGVSETPVGSRWDALMRAGRLLHATRDSVPEGLTGSGRWDILTRCRRDSPCLLCCRGLLFAPSGAQVGTSGAASARLGSQAPRIRVVPAGRPRGFSHPEPRNRVRRHLSSLTVSVPETIPTRFPFAQAESVTKMASIVNSDVGKGPRRLRSCRRERRRDCRCYEVLARL